MSQKESVKRQEIYIYRVASVEDKLRSERVALGCGVKVASVTQADGRYVAGP